MKMLRAVPAVAILICMFQGCASMPTAAEMREGLMTAAERYWSLRMEGKYKDTYELEDREGLPPSGDYQERVARMMKFTVSYSIREEVVEGNKGTVKMKVSLRLPDIPKPVGKEIHDSWVFKGGRWLHNFPPK